MVRVRDKKHLEFVAEHPCCICKGASVAHHLTIAEPKARGLKAGDNWTLPLCDRHHTELHNFGDENLYWLLYNIDPFSIAKELWSETENKNTNGKKKRRKRRKTNTRKNGNS